METIVFKSLNTETALTPNCWAGWGGDEEEQEETE
jgi:hypothetical protein